MGQTVAARLQKKLDESEANLRNANSSLAYVRTQRDEAQTESAEASQEIASLKESAQKYAEAVLADSIRQRQHIRRLFNSIFILNLELARKGGYIDRVKETDATDKVDLVEPELDRIWPEQVDAAREDLAGARSERMVNRVIDGMDSDVLDAVLGRDPDEDYPRG